MKSEPDVPPPEDAVSFAPEEFGLVYSLIAHSSRRIAARSKPGLKVTGGDDASVAGQARGAALGDAFAPVRERYEGDPVSYHSAVHRMVALAKMMRSSRLDEWRRVTKEGVAVHGAVLAAAATVRLTKNCEFDEGEFLEEVKRRASGHE